MIIRKKIHLDFYKLPLLLTKADINFAKGTIVTEGTGTNITDVVGKVLKIDSTFHAHILIDEDNGYKSDKWMFGFGITFEGICSICGGDVFGETPCKHWLWDDGFKIIPKNVEVLQGTLVKTKDYIDEIVIKIEDDEKIPLSRLK